MKITVSHRAKLLFKGVALAAIVTGLLAMQTMQSLHAAEPTSLSMQIKGHWDKGNDVAVLPVNPGEYTVPQIRAAFICGTGGMDVINIWLSSANSMAVIHYEDDQYFRIELNGRGHKAGRNNR